MNRFRRVTICGALLTAGVFANAQTATPSDRCAVAAFEQQHQQFFAALTPSALQDFGVGSLGELQDLSAGTPYLVYAIEPSVIVQNALPDDPEQALEPTGMWHIPLRSGQDIRLLALVQQTQDNQCRLVSMGYARLANGLSRLLTTKKQSVAEPQGRLVQIPQALETLWIEGSGSDIRAFRLSQWGSGSSEKKSATGALPAGEGLTEVLQQLKPMVTRNLNGG